MQIPKTVKIKGKTWSVVFKERVIVDGDLAEGACDFDNRIIEISTTVEQKDLPQVFLHEFNHAVLFEVHISTLNEHVEESLVDAIAACLVDSFEIRAYADQ